MITPDLFWPMPTRLLGVAARSFGWKTLCSLTAVGALVMGPMDHSTAQDAVSDGPAAADVRPAEGDQELVPVPAADSAIAQRRQNLASILMLLLTGVCLLGVTLIVGTVMWGAKLRREARNTQPAATQVDELWYLRSPLEAPSAMDDQAPPQTQVRGPDDESASSS